MPRKPSGRTLSGAERIARYRQRQRDAGRVLVWSAGTAKPSAATAAAPALDPNNPASLIAHWAAAVKTLQTVHRAYRKWIAKTEISGSPEAQAFNGLDETARDALDQIDKFEIALLNKRPPALSRASRWQNAVDELRELLDVYTQWLDNLPGSIRQSGSALVDKLEAMAEFDGAISELEGADPPLGWGRD